MPTKEVLTVPFFYLMQWEFIKKFPILKDSSPVEADIEYMLNVLKNHTEEKLTFCLDSADKIQLLENRIQLGLKWLELRIGGIYLLDGKIENLLEKLDFVELAEPINIAMNLSSP